MKKNIRHWKKAAIKDTPPAFTLAFFSPLSDAFSKRKLVLLAELNHPQIFTFEIKVFQSLNQKLNVNRFLQCKHKGSSINDVTVLGGRGPMILWRQN